MKKILWIIIALVVVFGLIAMSGDSNNEGGEGASTEKVMPEGAIKMGFIGPLTGDAAAYGEVIRNVSELAVKEINEAGGIEGHELELIVEDGKCNGKDATSAAQKLINVDGVQVVLPFCSGESLAIVPLAEANGVAAISQGSSSPDLTGSSPIFARTYPSDASQGAVLATAAFDAGHRKVAFIQEQTDYALGVYQAFTAQFEELGGAVIKEEFAPETTDFRTPLTKLKAEAPDALFVNPQTPAVGEKIVRQLQQLSWDLPLMINDGVAGDPTTLMENKDMLEGAFAAEFGIDESNEKFQAMIAAYEAAYGEPAFQSYMQTAYDAVYMIADAVREVGYDGTAIAAWFHSADGWEGASGSVTLGSDGDRVGGHILKVIRDGKTVVAK